MKIAISSDHAGWAYKEEIKKVLEIQKHHLIDFGPPAGKMVDYPDTIHPLANAIEQKHMEYGIILCGSGNGAVMTANKHQRVRAALAWKIEIAILARQHNNANVLGIPARFVTQKEALAIVEAFLKADFEEGRHLRRIEKIPVF
ncbi:RpiB/LacA/LacB family sugar-phosphate isomerase [Bacteroidetes bacterium endosymbiont of Geopemphigus sp.]|uniref:RpiB/LacA/LacB family sugar-phosphate isomerase n=1 Tax=Bacteroidetes bacterium endosymbiont of Geopemphigus sp. TaxID=2047937 RepID=UPI000CD1B17B|nr:RpiB/LacA/LacB family sugar-phosphate isomerase [Bacteroidetes bacterium endosymbiont of Geopemphigus sp.]